MLLGVMLFVATTQGDQSVLVEDVFTNGPMAGQTRTITKTLVSPKDSLLQQKAVLTLNVQGQKANIPVQLISHLHECTATRGSNTTSFTCYEFQLRADESGFIWSTWTPDFPRPHRFQVLTTESGTNYASYISDGVHLFRLTESRPSDAMRRQFWEAPNYYENTNPDALPSLPMDLLRQALGKTNIEGLGPQTWNISVDNLSTQANELIVTVHGAAPLLRCTFALRKDKWELVSTSIR